MINPMIISLANLLDLLDLIFTILSSALTIGVPFLYFGAKVDGILDKYKIEFKILAIATIVTLFFAFIIPRGDTCLKYAIYKSAQEQGITDPDEQLEYFKDMKVRIREMEKMI